MRKKKLTLDTLKVTGIEIQKPDTFELTYDGEPYHKFDDWIKTALEALSYNYDYSVYDPKSNKRSIRFMRAIP